jgi:hypothetical protein
MEHETYIIVAYTHTVFMFKESILMQITIFKEISYKIHLRAIFAIFNSRKQFYV